ncbi:cardiolipin synthase [Frigoribacterium sp. CFBP 8754]|uniref:cardiolipin synthase n=1 Tax=unclassified Frigoribacterium TaxID=2627005 RepID=UPI001780A04C|nr:MULTISPECIES: cardiolipin synthase [unclassified Frigoribacterium]MBD8661456.1 cardiolipin synthase [Frigoribacterium sp. CFBP 8754]MBD8729453.1 cardiolipin synthase [Frigoribacterium sp. CFBP 13707]
MRWRSVLKALPTVVLVVDIVIRVVSVAAVPRNRKPSSAMAWLTAIFVAPIPGSLLFGLIGSSKLPRDRREKQREINQRILDGTAGLDTKAATVETEPPWFGSVVKLNRTLGSMPLSPGNTAELLPDYRASIEAMTAAVDEAERYVHVEFYIFTRDETTFPFFDALKRAHDRGVQVRVLYDHWATIRNPQGRVTRRWLREAGLNFEEMLPFHPTKGMWRRPDLRNHRKIVVVDGDVAFTGSQNMTDPSYNKRGNIKRGLQWKDLMVRLDGPGAVGLNALFLTDWYSETDELPVVDDLEAPVERRTGPDAIECQVVPSGPGFDGENNLRLFNALVYGAQEKLIIASPYFVPDDSMLYAITTAAERGVDVQLFACEVADQFLVYHAQRSYYETLLRSGVRIFLYEKPIVLHSKHFTVDDDVAVVGSSNMDMRSFSLNFEVSLLVRGAHFVERLRAVEDDYRSKSREVHLDEWLTRPAAIQVVDNVARLTAAVQ